MDWFTRTWYKSPVFWIIAFIFALAVASDSPAATPAETWQAHAAQMEKRYDLPEGMVQVICWQETHWRNVVGAHGEIGVCQLKADTVRMICPACDGNARRTLFHVGSRGPEVLRIQAALSSGGYYLGPVDGIFGAGTRTAIVLYQQRASLPADGVVGPKTWSTMFVEPFPGTSISAALWEPLTNIEWAARYLVWLRETVSDDPMIMMAAYNGGPANSVVRYMVGLNKKLATMEPTNVEVPPVNRKGEL